MSGFISGVESDLTKSCQSMESIGTGLMDDVGETACHPLTSVERIGATTMDVLQRGARYVENTAESVYDKIRSGSRKGIQLAERELNNLDKVVTSHLPSHHTAQVANPSVSVPAPVAIAYPQVESKLEVQETPRKKTKESKKLFKKIINWVILVLVLILIGVIIYLTCKRYLLVGTAMSSGNNMMAAALLTPELSAGLTTLAAAL